MAITIIRYFTVRVFCTRYISKWRCITIHINNTTTILRGQIDTPTASSVCTVKWPTQKSEIAISSSLEEEGVATDMCSIGSTQ